MVYINSIVYLLLFVRLFMHLSIIFNKLISDCSSVFIIYFKRIHESFISSFYNIIYSIYIYIILIVFHILI